MAPAAGMACAQQSRAEDTAGVVAAAGTLAPAWPDFEAAGPDFKAAGSDFEAARPDFEAARPDFEAAGRDLEGGSGGIWGDPDEEEEEDENESLLSSPLWV